MNDRQRALELLQGAAENAIDEGMAGVMVIATDGIETVTAGETASDVDPRVIALWMLGAHLEHLQESARAAGGDAEKSRIARDAIGLVEEFGDAEGAGI